MPKRAKEALARPAPIQLPVLEEAASPVRIRPELREWRFYWMEVWPAFFGRALLLRQWGRLGMEGHRIRRQLLAAGNADRRIDLVSRSDDFARASDSSSGARPAAVACKDAPASPSPSRTTAVIPRTGNEMPRPFWAG